MYKIRENPDSISTMVISFLSQYIADMMSFVRKFYCDFIAKIPANKQKPPPPNFYNPRVNKKYAEFLQRTIGIAVSATLVVELKDEQIQRSPHNTEFFV